jgi:hypothetical protein
VWNSTFERRPETRLEATRQGSRPVVADRGVARTVRSVNDGQSTGAFWRTLAVAALAALGGATVPGCTHACVRNSDCPTSMTCSAAVCVSPPPSDAGDRDASADAARAEDARMADGGEADAAAEDASAVDDGGDAGADDAATADAGGLDAGEPDGG